MYARASKHARTRASTRTSSQAHTDTRALPASLNELLEGALVDEVVWISEWIVAFHAVVRSEAHEEDRVHQLAVLIERVHGVGLRSKGERL